jgi:hypothetical protein
MNGNDSNFALLSVGLEPRLSEKELVRGEIRLSKGTSVPDDLRFVVVDFLCTS